MTAAFDAKSGCFSRVAIPRSCTNEAGASDGERVRRIPCSRPACPWPRIGMPRLQPHANPSRLASGLRACERAHSFISQGFWDRRTCPSPLATMAVTAVAPACHALCFVRWMAHAHTCYPRRPPRFLCVLSRHSSTPAFDLLFSPLDLRCYFRPQEASTAASSPAPAPLPSVYVAPPHPCL